MIENFWDSFSKLHPKLVAPADGEAMEELIGQLHKVDTRLYYHLGSHDNGTDLILSAEGNPELMSVLSKLKSSAPAVSNWGVVTCFDAMLLFGQRDDQIYPNDINGDVLFKMAKEGDKQWVARELDFSLVFPSHESASKFVKALGIVNAKTQIKEYSGAEGYTHDVSVIINMFPTHRNITEFEKLLQKTSQPFGGRNDGWGCFRVEA